FRSIGQHVTEQVAGQASTGGLVGGHVKVVRRNGTGNTVDDGCAAIDVLALQVGINLYILGRIQAGRLVVKETRIEAWTQAVIENLGREGGKTLRFPDDNVRCAGFPFKEFAWYGFAQFEGDAVVGIGQWCEGSTDTGAQLELDADPAIIGVVDDFLDNAVETTDTVGFLEFRKGHAAVFGCVLDALVANIFYA